VDHYSQWISSTIENVETMDKTFEVFAVSMPPETNGAEKFAALD
jgi:hypothetical protein